MATSDITTRASQRVALGLTAEQLEDIVVHGQRDVAAGHIFGELYEDNELAELNNGTVTVLNILIADLKANPIDISEIDGMINGEDSAFMERFGDIFFHLVETQIYVQEGENGIPPNAYKVGHPLRGALEKLEQHQLREHPGCEIANGVFTKGPLGVDDEDWPVYDFMFDEDLDIVKCFWYIVKLISLVI
jgi:hypothetical protein